jgi:hypothetical protein
VFAALAAGGAVAMLVSALYARPYMAAHAGVGDRSEYDVLQYAARASSYRAATPGNWLYGGQLAASAGEERRLFPGFIPLVLAMVGLLLGVPGRRPIVYLLLMVAAFEMSLGLRGYSYAFLYEHVPLYRGLRALARLGIVVVMFLGVLAGYGYALLVSERSRAVRSAVAALLVMGLLAEYRTAIPLEAYPNVAPTVYRFLATQPRGIVAEFPVPELGALPGHDAEFAYMSTFHWFPLVNGYSGMYPPSYLGRLDRLSDFPGPGAIEQLRRDAVRYVIVHVFHYPSTESEPLLRSLDGSRRFHPARPLRRRQRSGHRVPAALVAPGLLCSARGGTQVTRRTLGILTSVVVSGLGAWWLANYRRSRVSSNTTPADRGEVIFRNTPVAPDTEALI